jgi:hypothetical protein
LISNQHEVVRNGRVNNEGVQEVFMETVDQNNISFGSGCPVDVINMCSQLVGEVIGPNLADIRDGNAAMSYAVKLFLSDGGIRVKDDVPASRIRYKFGLKQLLTQLRKECSSQRMIGIISNSSGVPMRKMSGAVQRKRVKSIVFLSTDKATLLQNPTSHHISLTSNVTLCRSESKIRTSPAAQPDVIDLADESHDEYSVATELGDSLATGSMNCFTNETVDLLLENPVMTKNTQS